MTRYGKKAAPRLNPVQLADNAVLGLASIERDGKVMLELLNEGIKLCEYLISLLEDLEMPQDRKSPFAFRAIHSDKQSLRDSKVKLDQVRQIKESLSDLVIDPSSHTKDEIKQMQEFFVTVSMPLWQQRTAESQERRLKRGLFIRE